MAKIKIRCGNCNKDFKIFKPKQKSDYALYVYRFDCPHCGLPQFMSFKSDVIRHQTIRGRKGDDQ